METGFTFSGKFLKMRLHFRPFRGPGRSLGPYCMSVCRDDNF